MVYLGLPEVEIKIPHIPSYEISTPMGLILYKFEKK